ncbi:hypothetical protein ACIBEF_00695 [Micromonospora sp. NPDC050795]|uniref:hypothetical protein n=1 Tax=Micromonospora sp. NPDC050795 TaxID=3364282 RepID=UPI0037958794
MTNEPNVTDQAAEGDSRRTAYEICHEVEYRQAVKHAERAAAKPNCWRCKTTPAAGSCCSSHNKNLCHLCYRRTHFVEVCVAGCFECAAENLPVKLSELKAVAS